MSKTKEIIMGELIKYPNFVSPIYEINGVDVSWDVVGDELRKENLENKTVQIVARISERLSKND